MVDNLIYRTKESVNNFKEDPINNLGFLIPVAIALISLGSGIVTYIMYIFNGGYTVQINAAKKYGWFGGYSEKFTSGTTGMITSGIIGKILLLLIGIEFVVMMINYFKHNEKGKRVVMIVDLSFLVIQVILIMNIFMASIGVLVIGSIITQISKLFGEIAITPQTVAWGYAIIVMVAIITFIVLILTKLGVYRYTSDGMIELDMESKGIQCVSPLQIIMSNGRYYVIVKNERKFQTQEFLFYRIDLMDEIEIIETKRKDAPRKYEWKNSQKFLIANPFFYSGKKEDIVIGFEEQQITQVVDWFGTEENGLFECLGTYFMEKPEKTSMTKVEMVKVRFPEVNVMAFSFWIMQYMDCVEVLEGDLLKKILKERMKWALENRIK